MTKDDIRQQILGKRDSLTPEELLEKSRAIFEKITNSEEYSTASDLLIYASMRSEVITDDIILDSLSQGKRVFCPKVTDRENGTMEFVQILAIEDLEEGYFGIREPVITDESVTFSGMDKDPEKALIVMPGVAFDRERNRIGYKGGFYDRFLADNPEIKAIALGFECQISDETLPTEGHDIRPLKLITEAGIY